MYNFKKTINRLGKNKTEMEITNSGGKSLPIPQIQLPRKVIGFEYLFIHFIDRNVIAFLHRLCPLFTSCGGINLDITSATDRSTLELILHNFWPMIAKNICGVDLSDDAFHRLRKFVPSFLDDCPSLRAVRFPMFAEFPVIDSAIASDGQAVAKWLFNPRPDDVPKMFQCIRRKYPGNWSLNIEAFKEVFTNASSPVNFFVLFVVCRPYFDSVVPFDLTNELTREQLALKTTGTTCCDDSRSFLLVRCPIARDASKWAKWEEEAIGWNFFKQWNYVSISIDEDDIEDGLLDATHGPSDQQQK